MKEREKERIEGEGRREDRKGGEGGRWIGLFRPI